MLGWPHFVHVPRGGMLMDADMCGSNRQMRNLAEKMRRDKLNTYISELATLVPMVAKSPKRMDKTSILRLTATYLRMNRTLTCADKEKIQLPSFLDSSCLYPQGFLEDMKGFLLVVTMAGKIVFVTHTVEKLLGHSQNDLFGQSLYNITCPEDHAELTKNLTPDRDPSAPDICAVGSASGVDDSSSDDTSSSSNQSMPSPRPVVAIPNEPPPPMERQKRSFHLRLSQRAVSRSEVPQYELVHVQGHLRVPQLPKDDSSGSKLKNDTVLVAVVTLFSETHIADMTLMEATRDEYITRHLIDGRFIYCDHRIAVVSGYLPEEVSGVSAFKFMHKDDFLYTMIALRQMYDRYGQGEGYGSSVYRLKCKNGLYIYMRTHGYVEYSKTTHQVESFICVNSLISEEEGVAGLKEMQSRYSANIIATGRAALMGITSSPHGADYANGSEKASSSEDALQADGQDPLDLAISQLISNFPSPAAGEDHNDIVSPLPDIQYIKVVNFSKTMPPPRLQAAKAGVIDTPTPYHEKRMKNLESPESVPPISPAPSTPESASTSSQERPTERPTVLRQTVITGLPSVFSVKPMTRVSTSVVTPPVRTEIVCIKQSAIVANTTVLKRTSSVADTDRIMSASKRPHTSYRSRKQEHETEEREAAESEWPKMTPEQQHQVIMMRETSPPRAVPNFPARHFPSQSPPPSSPPHTVSSAGKMLQSEALHSPNPSSPLDIALDQRSPSPFHALDCPMEGGDMLSYENIAVPSPRAENNLLSSIFMEQDNGPDFVEEMLAGGVVDMISGGADVLRAGLILNVHDALFVGEHDECLEEGNCPPVSLEQALPSEGHNVALRLVEEQLTRSHNELQSRMDHQGTQINSMVQDLQQVPRGNKVFGANITELKAEHRKQQQLLHSIQQDHRSSHCKEKLKVCSVKQDVGV